MAKTQKKPKLTKKMLQHLDKAEVRTILMTAMGVRPEQAYQADTKWCVDHIYNNQVEFAEADLSTIPVKKFRHPAVYTYVRKLQGYLLGKEESPGWPPMSTELENNPQTPVVSEEPKVKAVTPKKIQKPVKAEEPEEPIISERGKAIEAPLNIGKPVKQTIKFNKVAGFGNNKAVGAAEEDKMSEAVEALTAVVSENIKGTKSFYEKTSGSIADVEKQVEQNKNALLFIINSAILPEGQEITDLSEIPTPPY